MILRLADLYNTLLGLDRTDLLRNMMTPLEKDVDADLIQLGFVIYEMATGVELASPRPDPSILDTLDSSVADVLKYIFFTNMPRDRRSICTSAYEESLTEKRNSLMIEDLCQDNRKVDIDNLAQFALFHVANLPPMENLFEGFCLDSGMKTTIRHSTQANALRTQEYVALYLQEEAERLTHRRAEEKKKKNATPGSRSSTDISRRRSTKAQAERVNYRAKSSRSLASGKSRISVASQK